MVAANAGETVRGFSGISDDDISYYSDLYDVPPPESDDEAIKLAEKIRYWITQGRPKIGKYVNDKHTDDIILDSEIEEETKPKEEKPKKKRGLFGFFKK